MATNFNAKAGALKDRRRFGLTLIMLVAMALLAVTAVVGEHISYYRQSDGPDGLYTSNVRLVTRIHARINAEARIRRAKERGDALVSSLRDSIPASLRRSALGVEDPTIARGEALPLEYRYTDEEAPNAPPSRKSSVLSGALIVSNGEEYSYACQLALSCTRLWEAHNVEFVKWLAERADVMPVQRVDVLIDWCLWTSLHNDVPFWRETESYWRHIAQSKNPVYRKSALFFARRWARDWDEEKTLYLRALEGKDSTLAVEALCAVEERKIPDADLVRGMELVLDRISKNGESAFVGSDAPEVRAWALKALKRLE
ncbi:MAG: hypothetical protein RBU21_09060 [FCB group bacterium]|jgi:hypothetical protein|nr:hypothetical protein [FCB group bacterium]